MTSCWLGKTPPEPLQTRRTLPGIRNMLREQAAETMPCRRFHFGDHFIDLDQRLLYHGNLLLEPERKEYELIALLVEAYPKTESRGSTGRQPDWIPKRSARQWPDRARGCAATSRSGFGKSPYHQYAVATSQKRPLWVTLNSPIVS